MDTVTGEAHAAGLEPHDRRAVRPRRPEAVLPAARCSAGRPRSTRWSTSAVLLPTTTSGRGSPTTRPGPPSTCCRCSGAWRPTPGAPTRGTGPLRAGQYQVAQERGRRWSSADAYLHPATGRPNLTVRTGALTTRVLVEGGRPTW